MLYEVITELYYTSLELDLGSTQPLDSVTINRSRYTSKLHQDQGWRLLLVLDEQRRVVSWSTFNVYENGWQNKHEGWIVNLKPATGKPAGLVIPEGVRCPISEAEYICDFLGKPVTNLTESSTPEQKARLRITSYNVCYTKLLRQT